QAVARARSEANGSAQDALGRLIFQLNASPKEESAAGEQQSQEEMFALIGHSEAAARALPLSEWPKVFDQFGPDRPHLAKSLNTRGETLAVYGLSAARSLIERALAIREKELGSEHPETSISVKSLAHMLYKQGDFAGARRLFERALAIRENAFGPEHPATA